MGGSNKFDVCAHSRISLFLGVFMAHSGPPWAPQSLQNRMSELMKTTAMHIFAIEGSFEVSKHSFGAIEVSFEGPLRGHLGSQNSLKDAQTTCRFQLLVKHKGAGGLA